MSAEEKPSTPIWRTALDLVLHNWLTLILVGVLGYVLITDRLPAWRRSQAMIGQPAADFVLKDLEGKETRLSDYRGKKVLINFWATWCLPCRFEIPQLRALSADLADEDFVLLSITNENISKVAPFAERHEMNYTVLLDPREDSHLKYRIEQFPTLVWVDEEGRIDDVKLGLDPLLTWKVRWHVTGWPF